MINKYQNKNGGMKKIIILRQFDISIKIIRLNIRNIAIKVLNL